MPCQNPWWSSWQPCSWDRQVTCTLYAESGEGHLYMNCLPCTRTASCSDCSLQSPEHGACRQLSQRYERWRVSRWFPCSSPYCPSGSPVWGEGWCWPSSMILAWVESDMFHRLVNNRCKYLSLVSPYPIRDLVRTGDSFLQPFYLGRVGNSTTV